MDKAEADRLTRQFAMDAKLHEELRSRGTPRLGPSVWLLLAILGVVVFAGIAIAAA